MIVTFKNKAGQKRTIKQVMSVKFVSNKMVEIRQGDEFSKPTYKTKRHNIISIHEEADSPLGGLSL